MLKVQIAVPVPGVPLQLGGYRIIGRLGEKATQELLVAVVPGEERPDRLYVLKLFPSEDFDNVAAVAMLVNQARLTTLLHHPNIVRTHEVVVDEGVTFMVREYLDGQSLEGILAVHEQPGVRGFDLGMRLRLVCDVLDGLHYAHELRDGAGIPLNLVHGNVTPHNILVTYDGQAKLLDFGLTEMVTMSSPTRVGTAKGKVAYMAPEQVGNSAVITRASDIFQIGLLLWEGAVGHRAWQDMDEYEILLRLNGKHGTLFVPPAGADADLITICQRATALSPGERYPTALQFKHDVEAYMARRGISVTADAVGRYLADRFALERRELGQVLQARLKSDEFDELETLIASSTVVEPGTVVPTAASPDSEAFAQGDTIIEPGAVVQTAATTDSAAFVQRDTIVEPGAVVHEPFAQPTREPAREPPAAQALPEPAPAEVGVEPQPPLPSSDPKEAAAVPARPRRPRLRWSRITIAAGLVGLALALVLVPRSTRKEPSRLPALVPPPSATAPPVVSPIAPPVEPTPPSEDQEPEHVEEPAAVVPEYVPPSRQAPAARPKPSVASSKAGASKRVRAKATATSRRGKHAAKSLKPNRRR